MRAGEGSSEDQGLIRIERTISSMCALKGLMVSSSVVLKVAHNLSIGTIVKAMLS